MLARVAPLALFVALVAAACRGDGPTPPVPTPQPAVVALRANDVLVFAGQQVALNDLVWRVTDPQGREVTDYELTAHLPPGWTIRNDTVIAPATETRARLRITATYLPQSGANQYAAPLFADAPLDTTDTATVTSGVDLKARQWRVSFTCADSGRKAFMHDHRYIDSMRVTNAMVDSVVYASDSAWIPQFGGVAQIWYSGMVRRWLEDGAVVDTTFHMHEEVQRQAPDSIITGPPLPATERHPMVRVTPGTLAQLLRYEGGTFCARDWKRRRGPVTFQQVAAP